MQKLLNALTIEDRLLIDEYRQKWGQSHGFIAPIDEYLSVWAKNNERLYRLLGNQLMVKLPYEYEISQDFKERDINLITKKKEYSVIFEFTEKFLDLFRVPSPAQEKKFTDYYNSSSYVQSHYTVESYVVQRIHDMNWEAFYYMEFVKNSINSDIYLKMNEKKTLRFPSGTKPFRILSKLEPYFTQEIYDKILEIDPSFPCESVDEFKRMPALIDKMRNEISEVTNQNVKKASFVLSIHPLDFMTMSDNNNGWQSCMSWQDEGCYCMGTVEMMNSNNVLCCYIETPDRRMEIGEVGTWNSKLWRCLAYVEKSIICAGKSYPYYNESMSKFLVAAVQDLAKENFGWTYEFGPQLYQDMSRITPHRFENAQARIMKKSAVKHNILFETDRMYNDLFNANHYNYWCVRNKVKHTKIIHLSGPMVCNGCGQIMELDDVDRFYSGDDGEDYISTYNDRYGATDKLTCEPCRDRRCACCGKGFSPQDIKKHFIFKNRWGETQYVCSRCLYQISFCKHCHRSIDTATNLNWHYSRYAYYYCDNKDVNTWEKLNDYIQKNKDIEDKFRNLQHVSSHAEAREIIKFLEEKHKLVFVVGTLRDWCKDVPDITDHLPVDPSGHLGYYKFKLEKLDMEDSFMPRVIFYSPELSKDLDMYRYDNHIQFLADGPAHSEEEWEEIKEDPAIKKFQLN